MTAASTGHAIPAASIRVTNPSTGFTVTVKTGPDGKYRIDNLAAGSYEIAIDAEGFSPASEHVSLASAPQVRDFKLADLPNAPGALSLSDLGFTPQQTQANPQLQALLTRRTEMLRIHQRLGLIAAVPMVAAVITGPMAKAKGKNGQTVQEPTQANLDTHIALGGATTALYFSAAYFAIAAPRIADSRKHGAIRWHEALAFIHGPGMVLTPVLGIMAYKQENAGEKVHGIAAAHGAVAYITAASYGTAIVAVSWPIHVKFWEKQ